MPHLADIYHCTGCLSCVETCVSNALYPRWNDEEHLTYGIYQEKCIECRMCERNCPVINGYSYGINDLSLSVPYAAWSKDYPLRAKSTSGGIFAAIAYTVLSRGGVVFGAAMVNNEVKHIGIDKIKDLHLIQGSKYAQSNTNGTYKQVLDYLDQNRLVLFSGMGCQIAGLLNFLPHNRQYDNLFTVDLICGGVPSRALITKYLKYEGDSIKEICRFRNKEKYEFTVIDNTGEVSVIPLSRRPLPLCGFYTELTNKYICYDCPFVGAHRKSDITIGDYWGDVDFIREHEMGLSIVVIHSDKVKDLIDCSNIELHQVGWRTFLMNNTRMVYGKDGKGCSERRKHLARAISDYSYKRFLIDYANGATIAQPLCYMRKVICYLLGRIKRDKRKQFVLDLLKEIPSL